MAFDSFAVWVVLGLTAGVMGGMFGIGGGLVIVPALILMFGLDPKTASGTSLLAQLPPVALLAVLEYHRRGEMQMGTGLWIALGLLFGTLLGATLSGFIPAASMKRLYGGFLIVVGLYFLFVPQAIKPRPIPSPEPEIVQPAPARQASH